MRAPSTLDMRGISEAVARLRTAEARSVQSAASGRRIHKPSDDPEASARAVALRSQIQALAAEGAAATHGRAVLDPADTSLAALGALVEEAQTLGVQGASSLLTPGARSALAARIRGVSEALLAEGNRGVGGYSLFAGARTTGPAYTRAPDGSFVYAGDAGVRRIVVAGESLALNVPGAGILSGATNAGSTLEALASAVEAGDSTLATSALNSLESVRLQVSAARSELGIASARLERANQALLVRGEALSRALGEAEDADLAEVASELSRIQLFLGAALGAAGQAQHRNLFDVFA